MVDAGIGLDGANCEFLHYGLGDTLGVVGVEENGGIFSSCEEDDFSSWMTVCEFGNVEDLVVDEGLCIGR